jgi:disulfide bond formation protein DsbB
MLELISNTRLMNALGAAICAGMMGFALYAQHGLNLEPCPLCIFQRVATISLGVVFALAALQNPGRTGTTVYAVLLFVVAAAGAGVAGRHVWLQNLPPDKVPACGPGLDFMLDAFPFTEMLETVLSGSGECADISWSLLGLSMPVWVFIAMVGMGAAGVIINLLPRRAVAR